MRTKENTIRQRPIPINPNAVIQARQPIWSTSNANGACASVPQDIAKNIARPAKNAARLAGNHFEASARAPRKATDEPIPISTLPK